MLVDLHTHLDPATIAPEGLAERAEALGLEGLVIAGHNRLPALAPLGAGGPVLYAAAQVSTDRGHYLAIFPNPSMIPSLERVFGPPDEGGVWPVRDVVARTHALGGAIIAAHPYDPTLSHPGGDILFTLPSIQAVETVSPGHRAASPNAAIEAAETLGLPCVAGSDARTLDELGRAATLFTRHLENEAALIAALTSGACWAVDFGAPPEHLTKKGPQARAPSPSREREDPRRRRRRRR